MKQTMTLTQAAHHLLDLAAVHGDVPLVLYDLDSGIYQSATPENFEAQRMMDDSVRISLGMNNWHENPQAEPKVRPL